MEAEEQQQQQAGQQQLFDIESAAGAGADSKEHLRQLGMSKLDAVLSKAHAGQDPWEYQQRPKQQQNAEGEACSIAATPQMRPV
jgi:hypothetical protein